MEQLVWRAILPGSEVGPGITTCNPTLHCNYPQASSSVGTQTMTDRTGNTRQLLCRVRRGQETLGIYLHYSASLSARTQRKSTATRCEGLVLFSIPCHTLPVCICACVGASPRSSAVFLKKTWILVLHGWKGTNVLSFTGSTAKGGCFRHRPQSQGFLMSSCSTIAVCINFLLYFYWNFHVNGQAYPLTACSCSTGPNSTSG